MGMDEELSDEYQALLDEYNFEYDFIENHIVESSGKQIHKQCMNIFGRQLCICQFLEFIDDAKHLCFASKGHPKPKQPNMNLKMESIPDTSEAQKQMLVK